MRRLTLIFVLALGLASLTGCYGWNAHDPLHPVVGAGCECPPKPCRNYEPCGCGQGIINPFRPGSGY